MNNPHALGQGLLSFPAPLHQPAAAVYQPAAPVYQPSAPITNRQTMASTRKYSQEQIRFVLTRWATHDRDAIVTEFNAHFVDFQLNKKQVKYIKDTYVKHSAWIGEFGHLMTERQRKNAAGQGKTNTPDPTSKENVPLGGTSSPSGFPQPPTSHVVGGGMGNAFQPAATTNTIGLGIMNNAATFPAPGHYAVSQPNRAASRAPSVPQSPAISATATSLGPFVAGNTTMVNQIVSPSISSAAQYPNQNPTWTGQGLLGANITPSPVIPPRVLPVQGTQNGNMYAQLPSQAVGVASVQQSFLAALPPRPPSVASGRVQPFMAAGLSSPALQGTGTAQIQQMMPIGSPQLIQNVETPRVQRAASFTSPTKGFQAQRYTPTGTPPGLPSVRNTARQFPPTFSPSPSRRTSVSLANNIAQFNSQQITLPQASMAVQAADMLVGSPFHNVNGSRPPSHIQLPKQDFDQDGVWYSTSHDGCRIQERHRHSNDGSITTSTPNVLPQCLQGAERGAESVSQKNVPSPKKSPVAGPKQPVANPGVSLKQTPVTSPKNNQAAHNVNLRTQQQTPTTQQMDAIRQIQLQQYRAAQQAQQPQPLQQAQVAQTGPQLQHGQLAQNGQRRQSVQQSQPSQQQPQGAQAAQQAQQAHLFQSPQQAQTVQQLQQRQQLQRAQAAHRAQQAQQAQQPQRVQAVQQAQKLQSAQQAQVAQQQQRTQAQVAQQPQRAQAAIQQVQQAQRLQSAQQAQASQPVHQAQQAQAVKKVQQGPVRQPVHQPQHARNARQVQTAQQVRQAQAFNPVQQARAAQQARAQYTQAQPALGRAPIKLGQVRTPHQQAALGNCNSQRTNEGLSSPSKSPPATSGTTESAPTKYWWDEETEIDLAPGAFNPPKYLPDGSPNYAFFDRLPDIVDGHHCQHEVYDKFPHLPWSLGPSGPDSDMVPLLGDPLFDALVRALAEEEASAHSPSSSNPRKRQATADDTVSTGTQNATDGGDSERATKKRNVGDGLSVITATE